MYIRWLLILCKILFALFSEYNWLYIVDLCTLQLLPDKFHLHIRISFWFVLHIRKMSHHRYIKIMVIICSIDNAFLSIRRVAFYFNFPFVIKNLASLLFFNLGLEIWICHFFVSILWYSVPSSVMIFNRTVASPMDLPVILAVFWSADTSIANMIISIEICQLYFRLSP